MLRGWQPLVWLSAISLFAQVAAASESRFQIDSRQNLAILSRTGQVATAVDRIDGVYTLDASAVLRVNLQRLLEVSLAYERYPRMGVPNLRESHVVGAAPDGDHLYTWSRMSYLGRSSQHYLEVDVVRNLTSSGAVGVRWQLARLRDPWGYPEASAFTRLDGSWYLEPLGTEAVYVRYFVVAALDPSIPESMLSWVIRRQFAQGAGDLIRVLAREAAAGRTTALSE